MIKMVVTAWRKPGLSTAEFRDMWLREHGALVKQHAVAMGFVRYVQSHRLDSPAIEEFARMRGWTEAPDGLTEVWWSSREDMEAALGSPEGRAANAILAEDGRRWSDPTRISAFLSEEHVIFDYAG